MRSPIKRIVTGIDIGTHRTRVVVVEHTPGGAPRVIGTGHAESRGIRHGYLINKADALESIKGAVTHAEKSSGVRIKNAFLSLGGVSLESLSAKGTVSITRTSGEVSDQELRSAEQDAEKNLPNLSNKRIVHRLPISYELDGKEVLGDPHGLIGATIAVKMLFVTCLEHHLDDIIKSIEEIGIEVDEVIPSPLAASHIALTKKQRSVGCALVDIGAETVSLVVFENDVPISIHVFPIGSTDITNDIALGFKIPLEEAEKVKLNASSETFSKKKLTEIIEARLDDIFELIQKYLKKIGRDGLLPAGVIIIGGGAGIQNIEDLSKRALKLPSLAITNGSLLQGKPPVKDASWLVAYGLCLYGLRRPQTPKDSPLGSIFETLKNILKPFLP